MKKRTDPISNMGMVSLLMTFIILCLAVFSVLSLSSALSEYKYSRKLAENQTAYYAASAEATRKLQEIDEIYRENPEALSEMEGITLYSHPQSTVITYDIPIDQSFVLHVALQADSMDKSSREQSPAEALKITAWQKVAVTPWTADESVTLIKP